MCLKVRSSDIPKLEQTPKPITSAYMVFHAEGLAGIKSHYAAQLTGQSVRGFENGNHHFPAAKSALLTVDEPHADIPFFSSLPLLLWCYACNHHRFSAGEFIVGHAHLSLALHVQAMPHQQGTQCYSHTYTYINTYIYTNAKSPCNTISCLASRLTIKLVNYHVVSVYNQ